MLFKNIQTNSCGIFEVKFLLACFLGQHHHQSILQKSLSYTGRGSPLSHALHLKKCTALLQDSCTCFAKNKFKLNNVFKDSHVFLMKKSSLLVIGFKTTEPQTSPSLQNFVVGSVTISTVELTGTASEDQQKSKTIARQNIFDIFLVNNTRRIHNHWLGGKQTQALYFLQKKTTFGKYYTRKCCIFLVSITFQ